MPNNVKLLNLTLKIVCIAIIINLSFISYSIKQRFLYGFIYIMLNILLGGAVEMISQLTPSVVLYNGTFYFDISLFMLIAVTAIVYITIELVSRICTYKFNKSHSYTVSIKYNNCDILLPGLADTGNTAKDTFSGTPVIICQGIILHSGNKPCRIIPYSTVSGEGILYAIKPDYVSINDNNGNIKSVDALCASVESEKQLAIFNPILLN